MYCELGAELVIGIEQMTGPILTFQDLIDSRVRWVHDLLQFTKSASNEKKNIF